MLLEVRKMSRRKIKVLVSMSLKLVGEEGEKTGYVKERDDGKLQNDYNEI